MWLGGLPSIEVVAVAGESPTRSRRARVRGERHRRFRYELSGREVLNADVVRTNGIDDPLGDMLEPPEQRFNVVLVESDQDADGRAAMTVEFTPQRIDALVAVGIGHRAQVCDDASELAAALAIARDADVAVVVVGTNDEVETEGRDRASLDLPSSQNELVRKVADGEPELRHGGQRRFAGADAADALGFRRGWRDSPSPRPRREPRCRWWWTSNRAASSRWGAAPGTCGFAQRRARESGGRTPRALRSVTTAGRPSAGRPGPGWRRSGRGRGTRCRRALRRPCRSSRHRASSTARS